MKSWLRSRRLRHNNKESSASPQPSAATVDVSNRSNIILASDVADHGAMAEVWAQQTAESVLQRSQVIYRTKAEEEFINIQQRARQLEHMMLHYHAEHVTPKDSTQSVATSRSIRTPEASSADVPITTRSRSLSDVTDTLYKTTTPTAKFRERRPNPPRRTLSSGVIATDLSSKNGGLKRPDPDLPHICIYCKRGFATLTIALRLHPVCTVWSCKFLPGIQYAIYPTEVHGKLQALCCYCNESLGHEKQGRVKSALLRSHMKQHNFRNCDSAMYYSGQSFRQHLQDEHKAINDGTLFTAWMLLLKSSQRSQPSFFEQSEALPATLRTQTDPGFNSKESLVDKIRATPTNFMELNEDHRRAEPNKLRRKRSATTLSEQRPVHDAGDIPSVPPLPQHRLIQSPPPTSQSDASGQWATIQGYNAGLVFYRRRIDASMRNRLYVHNGDEPLPELSQQLFMRINGSVLGGLILHSSLIAAVPVRMTNSVDIYQV